MPFAVISRMVLGVLVRLALLALLHQPLRWHRAARLTYLAGGLGLWGAMTSVYWAARLIPSGLISVLFGLTPVVTGAMAALWVGERLLTPVLALLIGQYANADPIGMRKVAGTGIILAGLALYQWGERLRRSASTG